MTKLYAQPIARNVTLAVTTASVEAAKATMIDQPRKQIIFRNTSPNAADIITLSMGGASAIAEEGIVLRQYDTYMESTVNNPTFDVWQGAIQAVCATANGQLSINEV